MKADAGDVVDAAFPAEGDVISVPELRLTPTTAGVGRLFHVLNEAHRCEVKSRETIKISSRRSAPLLHLANGERIVAVSSMRVERPDGADGVLFRATPDVPWEWRAHRLLDAFQPEPAPEALGEVARRAGVEWPDYFKLRTEGRDDDHSVRPGLRPPQLAALHAIAAHWLMESSVATVVMPTGTGKTETMLGAIAAHGWGTFLVVVPTDALRKQTLRKARTMGLLKRLGLLDRAATLPVVGLVVKRPKRDDDLDFMKQCNIVVATVSSVAGGSANDHLAALVQRCTHLIVDEAHHVKASTWSTLRDAFTDRPVLQFTATPFRRDGQEVDGEIIFNYALSRAQRDGYFKPINFVGVEGGSTATADRHIAERAIEVLGEDVEAGLDHLVMARCASIQRAEAVHTIYSNIAPQHHPVLVHSKLPSVENDRLLNQLNRRESRIVVCVDMLGEGFDLPQLKIAALHDIHKSLAILLQFTGRFTRVGDAIGDATVIASAAGENLPEALERLYTEDADWNTLLANYSFEAVQQQQVLLEFLRDSERLDQPDPNTPVPLSANTFHPVHSAAAFRCDSFSPRKFFEGLPSNAIVKGAWLNPRLNVLWVATLSQARVRWARSKKVVDTMWDLFVLHYNEEQGLLYLHSSNKSSFHLDLVRAVSGKSAALVKNESVFRCFGRINRLVFQTVGLKTRGRRTLRYSMFSGTDVAAALSPAQTSKSERSNFFGAGFSGGRRVNFGCSYKGRVWSREGGSVHGFVAWCRGVGEKLHDDTLNTDDILDNVLIPYEVDALPNKTVLSLEWPAELLSYAEQRVEIADATGSYGLFEWGIEVDAYDTAHNAYSFTLIHADTKTTYRLAIDPLTTMGYSLVQTAGPALSINVGRRTDTPLVNYLSESPPSILFVDGAELEGCILVEPRDWSPPPIPNQRLVGWDWSPVDITKESMWKGGQLRADSIQSHVADVYVGDGYTVVFDDDDSGEAADLICMRERDDAVDLVLIHCKFSGEAAPGHRIKDVVEVCSQAVRSVRWAGNFRLLTTHMQHRETVRGGRVTRYLRGAYSDVKDLLKATKSKPVDMKVVAVQPGLQKASASDEQLVVLSAAHGYLLETAAVGLDVVCSP